MKRFISKYWILMAAALFLLLHVPFLQADPPDKVSWSRGPWTDEGIYLGQLRNAINHGHLDINESDCVAKTPLFNLMMYPVLKVFGTNWMVARLFVLLATLFTFAFLLFRSKRSWAWIASILLLGSQFYVFQYAHFAQAELLQCDFILLALFFFIRIGNDADLKSRNYGNIFLSCLFIAFSYYTKISSLYLILVVPAGLFLHFILAFWFDKTDWKRRLMQVLASIGFTIFFALIYYACWYLPFKDTFELFNENELSSVTGFEFSMSDYFRLFPFNHSVLMKDKSLFLYILLTEISIIGILVLSALKIKGKKKDKNLFPLLFIGFWLLLEMHKFGYHYLPQRYLIFTILAASCLAGFVFQAILKQHKIIGGIFLFLLIFVVGNNVRFYADSYLNRHYEIKAMNDYLGNYNLSNETIIGPWAPTATWVCRAKTIPIWRDYYYHEDPINRFHPRIIISELDETDSDSAYSKMNVHLKEISDSSRQYNINLWKPVVYWLKK